MLALYTGEVKPEGIDLRYTIEENPRNIFDKMSGSLAFDACEVSSSEFVACFATQQCHFVLRRLRLREIAALLDGRRLTEWRVPSDPSLNLL